MTLWASWAGSRSAVTASVSQQEQKLLGHCSSHYPLVSILTLNLGMVTKHVYYIQVCSWPTWPRSMMFVTLSWMTCTKSPPVPCLPWTLWWTPPLSTLYWPTFSWWAGNAWIIVILFLSHLYKMFSLRRWTRWLLLPWLIIYLLDILLLAAFTVLLCLYPPPLLSSSHVNYSLLR